MVHSDERGFTLPELLTAIAGFVILFGVAIFLLAPDTHTDERLDAKRRLDAASIAQAINRYVADNKELPPYMPAGLTSIGSSEGEYDLCLALTPKYAPTLPLDPKSGIKADAEGQTEAGTAVDCDDPEAAYSTGYGIASGEAGDIAVTALLTSGEPFEVRTPGHAAQASKIPYCPAVDSGVC